MQTVAGLAKRLGVDAEQALEKLRYMMFEVESVDSEVTDQECDLLIEIEEDPEVAEKTRAARLKDKQKAEAKAQKEEAKRRAAEKKKKAAVKRKKKQA